MTQFKGFGAVFAVIMVLILVTTILVSAQTEDNPSNETIDDGSLVINSTITDNEDTPENQDNGDEIDDAEEIIEEIETFVDINITSIVPYKFMVGDVQFNIQVKNTGTADLSNIFAIVTGKGFSTYEIVPIDYLRPGEKSYIIVMGNFKESGMIPISIRIMNKTIHGNVVVEGPADDTKDEKEQEEKNRIDQERLDILSAKLKVLKANYSDLQEQYYSKKYDNYDVTSISIEGDLKDFIQEAESSLIAGDIKQANIIMTLGIEEFEFQREKVIEAKQIKKSVLEIIKSNIVIFSTIAASVITLFSFYELMKKKKEVVSTHITHRISAIKDKRKNSDVKSKDAPAQAADAKEDKPAKKAKPGKKKARKK
ncbi:MAG: hypothetical protein KKE20_00145 [Nanoarchaeota archaeon]|nr:hypothetical protein [Nanoarchaeota archaeon]